MSGGIFVFCPFLDAVHHNERFEHPLLAGNGVFSSGKYEFHHACMGKV